jgi:GR25 family glycosyltransferase involved in LPS biosynthesis
MNNPFDFFDKIYCINLPESVNRKAKVSNVFTDLGILNRVKFDSFTPRPSEGIELSNVKKACPGVFGVSLSNLKVMFDAANNGCKNLLVFEDDIKLKSEVFRSKSILALAINELPEDWDVLYLGGKPKDKVEKYSNNLVKVGHMVGAYAYAINGKSLILFLNRFISEINKYPHDGTIGSYAAENNGFCVYPPIISTEPGISVLRNAFRDYEEDTNSFWKKNGI